MVSGGSGRVSTPPGSARAATRTPQLATAQPGDLGDRRHQPGASAAPPWATPALPGREVPPGHPRRRRGHPDHLQPRGAWARRSPSTWCPRTAEDQLAWMDEHSGAHPAVVAVDDLDRVCGFGSLSPYRPRPAYRTTVEDSVYVDDDGAGPGRRPGPARPNWSRLAGAHGFHAVMARIVGGHEASIGLHRGVRLRARRRGAGGGPQVRTLAGRRAHAASDRSRS